jgi:hypothetical protein
MQQSLCTSFKQELLNAVHNFSTDTFKIALYTQNSTIGPNTTVYVSVNEVAASAYYTTGGIALTVSPTPTISGTGVYASFNNAVWSAGNISASGALVYNSSKSNKAVMVLNFGSVKSSNLFTVTFPVATITSAIVRIP